MNFNYLKNMQPIYDELKVIDKKTSIYGVIVEILGLVLCEKKLTLYAIQYDENAWLAEQDAKEQPKKYVRRPKTNRQMLMKKSEVEYQIPFQNISTIKIGGKVFNVSVGSSSRLSDDDFQMTLLINEFMREGFCASTNIEYVNFSGLMLTALDLEGEFEQIPLIDGEDKILLTLGKSFRSYPARKKMTLGVNKNYLRAFTCGNGENTIKFYINRVYLMDLGAEMEKIFENYELQEKFPPEDLKRARKESDMYVHELCPKGKLLPVIEYETEKAGLQFYLQEYLSAEPSCNSSSLSFGLRIKPDEKTGTHGLTLKAAALEAAVPEDTDEIHVEILEYYLPLEEKNIEI